MNLSDSVLLFICALIFGYLFYALLKPEKF
ncbi:MAG: K(+)-transporting ATPase subunit F [Candidatus Acidiferrales bacterium]|jgi:K+-transporting ATPase KdpF subunit